MSAMYEVHLDELNAAQAGDAWLKRLAENHGGDRFETLSGQTPGGVRSAWRGNSLIGFYAVLRDARNCTVLAGWTSTHLRAAAPADEAEHELFELALELTPFERERDDAGRYKDACVQDAWAGWAAARTSLKASVERSPVLAERVVIDAQAEKKAHLDWWQALPYIAVSGFVDSERAWLARAQLAPVLADEMTALEGWMRQHNLNDSFHTACILAAWQQRAQRAVVAIAPDIAGLLGTVQSHVNDLQRCASTLLDLPEFHETRQEIELAVSELSAAMRPLQRGAAE